MKNIITIPPEKPEYTTGWKLHIWFDEFGPTCYRGHSKWGINFIAHYDDIMFGTKAQIESNFLEWYILPYLKDNKLVETDELGLMYASKKLKSLYPNALYMR